MFGTNSIRGKSAFENVGNRLLVTSTFLTLQGEGPFQGQAAYFIRLAYCNLNCSFCDTFFDEGDWFTTNQLLTRTVNEVHTKFNSLENCGIVITGGEPSLQAENVAQFLHCLDEVNVKFMQIETNGIIPFKGLPTGTTLVVSPKVSEQSGRYLVPHDQTMLRATCMKFVISADDTSPYHTVPHWAIEWAKREGRPIYVSPMNMYKPEVLANAKRRAQERKLHAIDYRSTVDEVVSGWDDKVLDREKNRVNHEYAARYALNNGLNLTLQMQLFASIA